ncbi:MAG: 4-hydroxybenzoate octaprenyltransferase, partial [bacterium]
PTPVPARTPDSTLHTPPALARPLPWTRCVRLAAADIKLSHSVFALPFALLGALVAHEPSQRWGRLIGPLVLIGVCMVAARTWAMLVNRLADARFDAANPRTARRVIASGQLHARQGWTLALASAAVFLLACAAFWFLFANPWPIALGVPVLGWLALYSYAKRFTALCHVLLGSALAISPIAAGLAVDPVRAFSGTSILLAGFVMLWVAGFDVLYALQDEAFDRQAGLHSIPVAVGARRGVVLARILHAGASVCLLLASLGARGPLALGDPRLGALMLLAWALATALLVVEHVVLVRRGLAGLPVAFFTINGVLSLAVGTLGAIDIVLG